MKRDMQHGHAALLFAVYLLLGNSSAWPEELLLIQEVPNPAELGEILFPESGAAPQVRVRSIRFTQPAPEETQAPVPQAVAGDTMAQETDGAAGTAVGFNIQFAYDSAEPLPETLPYLDAVGQMMLQERTRDARLLIAGHADAAGEPDYNRALSRARADSVRRYLQDNYHLEAGRLETVGYGEERPLPDTDPMDGMNRRVEFHPVD